MVVVGLAKHTRGGYVRAARRHTASVCARESRKVRCENAAHGASGIKRIDFISRRSTNDRTQHTYTCTKTLAQQEQGSSSSSGGGGKRPHPGEERQKSTANPREPFISLALGDARFSVPAGAAATAA